VAAGFELGVGEDVGSGCHPVNRHSYALKQALQYTGLEGDEKKRTEQENHFDPRDVTNPGWPKG
jgi:hypothetical protein